MNKSVWHKARLLSWHGHSPSYSTAELVQGPKSQVSLLEGDIAADFWNHVCCLPEMSSRYVHSASHKGKQSALSLLSHVSLLHGGRRHNHVKAAVGVFRDFARQDLTFSQWPA